MTLFLSAQESGATSSASGRALLYLVNNPLLLLFKFML